MTWSNHALSYNWKNNPIQVNQTAGKNEEDIIDWFTNIILIQTNTKFTSMFHSNHCHTAKRSNNQ